jgi:hypothetical protein
MNWSDFFTHLTDPDLFGVRHRVERERRLRHLAEQSHEEQLASMMNENAQLMLLLAAVTGLLN